MATGAPPLVDDKGDPQPFTHLGVPNADLYRSLLRTFARAKERFIVHLRPEDVAADLRIGADEQLVQALEQLVLWGNLRADVDTSRVTTVADFHRKRCLYQLTGAGQAAEQAIAFYEEAIGRPVSCSRWHWLTSPTGCDRSGSSLRTPIPTRPRFTCCCCLLRSGSHRWPTTHRRSCPRCGELSTSRTGMSMASSPTRNG